MLYRCWSKEESRKARQGSEGVTIKAKEILMHVPDKHMCERVEDAMLEEGEKAIKEHDRPAPSGPTIKIVINMSDKPHHKPPHKLMPLKNKRKEKNNPHNSGPMEDALRTAY